MNYCSNCGSSNIEFIIPKGDNRPRYYCPDCGMIHYINPNMVVGCIPIYEGKIMLAKRGIEPRLGYWNLPCGFLELDEDVKTGAIREVKEETGIDVTINYLHTVYSVLKSNQVYLIFKAEMQHKEFTLTEESTAIKLFALDEIPWDEIAFSANLFALKKLIEDEKNGFSKTHIETLNIKND